MNNKQKVINFYLRNINSNVDKKRLISAVNKLMIKSSYNKIITGLNNFLDSHFWSEFKEVKPEWILNKERIELYCECTLYLDEEYNSEIKKVSEWFLYYYNFSILKEYQEYMRYYPFISKKTHHDDIKKVSCFIIKNKVKMAAKVGIRSLEKITYLFVNTLFYVFNNNPPELHQYLEDSERFWDWFDLSWESNYITYDGHVQLNSFIEPLIEIKYSNEEIKDFYEQEKENRRAYQDQTIDEGLKALFFKDS